LRQQRTVWQQEEQLSFVQSKSTISRERTITDLLLPKLRTPIVVNSL
jgi:hypothetical protein